MRPDAISGYSTNGSSLYGAFGQSTGSTGLWAGITLVNALLLAAAIYGTYRLVCWADEQG